MDFKDKLKKVLAEYKSLGIAEQIDYDKFYLYSLITHSTAIESSNLRKVDTKQEGWTEKVDRKTRLSESKESRNTWH